MAQYAHIDVQFIDLIPPSWWIRINFRNEITSDVYQRQWTFKALRSSAYDVELGITEEDQAIKFMNAVNADISNDSVLAGKWFATSLNSTTIRIQAVLYTWDIEGNSVSATGYTTRTQQDNILPEKEFELTGYSISRALDEGPCTHVRVNLTHVDGVPDFIWISPAITPEGDGTYGEIERQATDQTISITVEDSEEDQATLTGVVIPKIFTSADIVNISVVTNPGGLDATVTIFMSKSYPYQYSLDGVEWQDSNVFTGVLAGSKTAYVLEFGCVATKAFTVDLAESIVRPSPFAMVSKANSLRMIADGIYPYRTLENTLYRDERYQSEYKPFYEQPYQNSDGNITMQFKTNYDQLTARLLDCDDNIVSTYTIEQKSENTGLSDKRDAILFNAGNNQTGIYYPYGNLYDPTTDAIIGSYDLSGRLPEYAVVGNTVIFNSGSYIIKQVKFDSTVQANVIIVDAVYDELTNTIPSIVSCTYNRQPYEVYEFVIDLTSVDGLYYVQLILEDSLEIWESITFNSETIEVRDQHRHTNVIEYSDSPAMGIDYTTGYTGKVRIKSLDPYANLEPGGESQTYEDTTSEMIILKSYPSLEGLMFFQAIPRYMVEKLRIIIAHKNVWINGEKWTAIEGVEVINFDKSSLKNCQIKFRRNEYNEYNEDNIKIDALNPAINQENGAILQ